MSKLFRSLVVVAAAFALHFLFGVGEAGKAVVALVLVVLSFLRYCD